MTATAEGEALVGLNKETGQEVWRQEAAGFNATWGTPALVQVDERRIDLAIAVPKEIWGLNPYTGKLRWYAEGMQTWNLKSTVISREGVVYAIESGPGGVGGIAVRAGGSQDVSKSHILWTARHPSRTATPILYEGCLYTFSNKIMTCINAKTGQETFKARLQPFVSSRPEGERGGVREGVSGDYASPVIGDGKIYFVSRSGDVFVLKVNEKFEQLAVNRMGDKDENFSATPAIDKDQLFIRSSKYLYSIRLAEGLDSVGGSQNQDNVTTQRPQAGSPEETIQREPQSRPGPGQYSGRGGFNPIAFFRRLDVDGNGSLTADEIQGRIRNNLEQSHPSPLPQHLQQKLPSYLKPCGKLRYP